MNDLLTPKQLARAINVSESSVKRWCDKGVIATQYTAGGHRRLAISDVLEFLREGRHQIVHPEALGLPPTSGKSARVLERARQQVTEALLSGNDGQCRQIAIDLYLADHRLSVICDDVFAAAFREIGQRWSCGDAAVYQERRGCEITLRVLHELRRLIAQPSESAPLALGGAAAGDQYSLGTSMAELVLRDTKWNATSLGDNLPFATIATALETHRPRLFWLSCSYVADESEFLAGYQGLFDRFGHDIAFVVGGYALSDAMRQQMKFAAHCDNMQHLEGFAQTLWTAIDAKTTDEEDASGSST